MAFERREILRRRERQDAVVDMEIRPEQADRSSMEEVDVGKSDHCRETRRMVNGESWMDFSLKEFSMSDEALFLEAIVVVEIVETYFGSELVYMGMG